MVLEPGREEQAEAIFRKWGLDFAVIGQTTDKLRFVVKHQRRNQRRSADQGSLATRRRVYDRPARADAQAGRARRATSPPPMSNADALLRLVGIAGSLLASAGSTSNTTSSIHRQYGRGAGRRRRRHPARRRAEGPGADHRRARRAIARPILSRAASRPWPRPGAISPRSARIRWR